MLFKITVVFLLFYIGCLLESILQEMRNFK